jgi:hypothetical protein
MKLVGNSRAIRSPEFHKKKQREGVLKTVLVSAALLAILISPVFALRHDRFLVKQIDIRGNEVTPDEEIVDIVNGRVEGKYLGLIPKSNFLLVREDAISEEILSKIPRVSSALVDTQGMDTLVIDISERKPSALYCEDVSDVGNPSKCFFLDDTGNIFSKAPDFSGSVYVIYSSEPAIEVPLRTQLIEPGEFAEIRSFLSDISKVDLAPRAVVKRGAEYAAILSGGTELKWKSGQNLSALASDLTSFLNDPKTKKIAFGDLLYIDLRFENKIYWLPKE